ncbi:hypothetical protein ACVIHD_003186 [Bradyrhizobium embrapense]
MQSHSRQVSGPLHLAIIVTAHLLCMTLLVALSV